MVVAGLYLLCSRCAGDRWSVKTLSDSDKSRAILKPVATTVEQLRRIPMPHYLPSDRRLDPVELTTYLLKARVVGIQKMWDHDFHLVISAPHDPSRTMIAEFVDPDCAGAFDSPEVLQFTKARQAFLSLFGVPRHHFTVKGAGQMVELTGVGFFDEIHGEAGQAPNGIELHPVFGLRTAQ
jgi:hypothetical protein